MGHPKLDEGQAARRRQVAVAAIVGLLLYEGFIPILWPAPTARVTLPARARLNEDLRVQVQVRAWHSNVELAQVRFYVDHNRSSAVGPQGPLYAVMLHQVAPRRGWGYWRMSRITWPRTWRRTLTVPLGRLAREGRLRPGVLSGKVDVTVSYPRVTRYGHLPDWAFPAVERMHSTPFTLDVMPPRTGA